jgi:formamidopyrimidine-DNA glycosylase
MPELPDITVYLERLAEKVQGRVLRKVKVLNPFLLRTAVPPLAEAEGRTVTGVERLGKRVVLALDNGLFLVIHLMVAGRLRWLLPGGKPPGKISLAVFEFDDGSVVLTEAGSKRRASLHVLADRAALQAMDPGGLDPMTATLAQFTERLQRENHTMKKVLTDPRLFSGIGNTYSDEILFRAKLSPVLLSQKMAPEQVAALFEATQRVLQEWTDRLRQEAGDWPEKVTAFHPQMAVHGRYGQPCPVCGTPVQRIVYADNETNYCARCQTGGKLLADRALSTLLHKGWPKNIDELG